ncbi:hypothetical protein ACEWY4_004450 [Coilia grayii]|uniref:Senataxin n=1 Tax=Coilia grayii TaxID=363190 RepID=A0ABD1KM39_9TELE
MEVCLWCTKKRKEVAQFLERYASKTLDQEDYQTATNDLKVCADCVAEYHLARSQLPHLHTRLWELETSRLLTHFSQLAEEELQDDDIFYVEDGEEKPVPKMSMHDVEAALRMAVTEILQYPYLLAHPKLSDLCLEALFKVNSSAITEKYQGIYLLLVHPNEKVRSWAIEKAQNLQSVDRDDFYDLEEVLTCMFQVLELGISFTVDDLPPASNGKLTYMPTHLYDATNEKNYWLGISMLLTCLDTEAMDSLFFGRGKKANILQLIFNAMDGDVFDNTSESFWAVLQCFMVILDRLGSLIWCYEDPTKAFNKIAHNATYQLKINTIKSSARVKAEHQDEPQVTCSQMVVDTFLQQKATQSVKFDKEVYRRMTYLNSLLRSELGKEMHSSSSDSAFLWFIPYVRSVMSMELATSYVGQVVQYLGCHSMQANVDLSTIFFAYILAYVVELLLTDRRGDILHNCSEIWTKVIVRGSRLDMAAAWQHEKCSSSVSSTSFKKGFADFASSSMSSTLQEMCLKNIRLLLKEGGSQSAEMEKKRVYFLNLLKKHMRGPTGGEWILTKSECSELQKCLMHLVSDLVKKETTFPTVSATLSALPTPPAESAAMESPFVGIKGEPLNNSPVRDVDFTSASVKEHRAVDRLNVKPDPGKVQAICTRLSENLSKLQAIARNKPNEGTDGSLPLLPLEEKSSPGNPCPSTSKCAQTALCSDEGDKEEDELLSALQQRLCQQKRKSNFKDLVFPVEDMASLSTAEKEPEDKGESPGRDFNGDLSESQVFEFETQEDVVSAWGDSHFDSVVSKQGLKASSPKGHPSTGCKTDFVKPKSLPFKAPTKEPKPPPPVIEPQPLRKKKTAAACHAAKAANVKASVEAPVDAPSVSHVSTNTPFIVPPKKIREAPKPESEVERMGLKKRKRMAFDLSQRSLDYVGELRRHGKEVHVKPVSTKAKGKKQKLLPSQELQFFRQSRKQTEKVTSPTRLTTPLSPGRQAQKNRPYVEEKEKQKDTEQKRDGAGHASILSCDKEQQSNGSGDGTRTSTAVDCSGAEESHDDFEDHNWNLTLLDPTDMELCSQMEQFEQENDEEDDSIFLTQRDPVDMDIDEEDEPITTILPAHPPKETTQPPSLPQPSMVQMPPPSHGSDDRLFLKPGMSPMTQKKARPSTTKIYTPSSRSETLVKDMAKLPVPKTKPVPQGLMRPPPVPPPKRVQLVQPEHTPPVVPKPLPLPPRTVEPCYKPLPQPTPMHRTSHPQAYALSSRPHSFAQNLKPAILKAKVLKWEYKWFEEYKQFGPPEALCNKSAKVPESFMSFQDYYLTFFPLLLTNTFEELATEWQREDRVRLQLAVRSADYSSLDNGLFKVTNANLAASVTPQQESKQLYPKEDDVVILWLPQRSVSYFNDGHRTEFQHHFGIVSRSNVVNAGGKRELKLTVQTCADVLSVHNQFIHCEVVGSILSAMREFNALCYIHDKALIRTILKPEENFLHFLPTSTVHDCGSKIQGCNVDQAKAVDCSVSMVMSDQQVPKICMIHGPPGTGKSDTIVQLLYRLSRAGEADPSGQKHLHVLVCAPSNAAIDNLMKKIIVFFKEKCKDGKAKGNCGDVNLVRLGSEKTICGDVVAFGLDRQTRSRTEKAQQQEKCITQKIAELEQNMQNLARIRAMTKDPWQPAQLQSKDLQLNQERERLSRQRKECNSDYRNTQRLILQEANIICCTLSTSGSVVLEAAFRRRGRVPFNCVIVDEAGQAKETETLIPMLYRCRSIVLVGDPEQLPPTVISQKVKELGYDQSLMARLYKCVHRLKPPRIHFLSLQYRMHPEICSFPSRYIYNNVLKTDRVVAQSRLSGDWAWESYRVFDVIDGQELKQNDTYVNPKEVKLTVELVRLITERYLHRSPSQSLRGVIGVITPYNGQKYRIRSALSEKGLSKVVVDTVDGFQGREMDCIIVSCVRASNEMGSIGFLGSLQRMNVTITRAKCSLFVLGHLRTLREHRAWKALIEDAESRGTVITTQEHQFKMDALRIFKREARGQCPADRPRDQRQAQGSSSGTALSGHPLARGPCPADHPRDQRQAQGSSSSSSSSSSRAAPSGHPPTRSSRDPRRPRTNERDRPSSHQPPAPRTRKAK